MAIAEAPTTVNEDITRLAEEEGEPLELANVFVRTLAHSIVRSLAGLYVADAIAHARRESARRVETAAAEGPVRTVYLSQARSERIALIQQERAREEAQAAETQRAFDAGEVSLEAALATFDNLQTQTTGPLRGLIVPYFVNVDGEPWLAFEQRFAGLSSYRTHGERIQRKAEEFGCEEKARRDAREQAGMPRVSEGYASDLRHLLDSFASKVRLDVTRELLATEFAIGDGRLVTWGSATIEDHEARIAMQVEHAAGSMQDAGRHKAAIDMLREAGAPCLSALAVDA